MAREWITGRNPVYEVLRAQRRQAFRLWLASGVQEKGRLVEIVHLADSRHIPIERVPRARLDTLSDNHQGLALEASGYPYSGVADMLDLARERGEEPWILVLDTIQNPQNLGTLLRTGETAGIHGAILPLRRAAGVTPAVVSASAGACEHLLVAQANLAQEIAELKEAGVWVVGLESGAEALAPERVRLDGPLALVVGSEGEGMRPLVRQSCDWLVRLPMHGKIESLNAAAAGSIVLYLVEAARNQKQVKQTPK